MKHLSIITLIAIWSCLAISCQKSPESVDETDEKVEILEAKLSPEFESAKMIFENVCSGCHGAQMEAFVDRKWKHGSSKDSLEMSIRNGIEGTEMVAFGGAYSDEEIKNLVDYISYGIENVAAFDFASETKSDTFPSGDLTLVIDTVMKDLGVPWGLDFMPNGDILVTEREGRVFLVSGETKTEIQGVPEVVSKNQGGMLDVAVHPNYDQNGWIYLSYSAPKPDKESTTAIVRGKLSGNQFVEQEDIFEALPYSKRVHHYGSRLEFAPDGKLFFTVGDRGNRDKNPQSLENHCGKVHRINDDGSIPEDNPFVATEGAMPSIYSYGNRNLQGLALRPGTSQLWEHEHGPRGGDEINLITAGTNYGWPKVSYGINYNGTPFTQKTSSPEFEEPKVYWVPSIAPSGMAFIQGNKYPGWEGAIASGSLRFNYVNLSFLDGDNIVREEKILQNIGRVRNVEMGPDGYLYVGVEDPGLVLRVRAL